jgi:hypothetical protein
VARHQRLRATEVTALFDPPTEQRDLVRHFTLLKADLLAIGRFHGEDDRLGHALMLCYLRYPFRALRAAERPPVALLEFVADQIGVLPEAIGGYFARSGIASDMP